MPEDVGAWSKKRVWWVCSRCGHEWPAVVKYRFGYSTHKPTGCPVCANRSKGTLREWCLANDRDDLLEQFDYARNDFTPDDVSAGSNRRAHWAHFDRESGMLHPWEAMVASRTKAENPSGCPYCAGVRTLPGYNDFATRHPDLMAFWDYEVNSVDPASVPHTSSKSVSWRCPTCGSSWKCSPVAMRGRKAPCRVCGREERLDAARSHARRPAVAGEDDLATTHPAVAALWHPFKNGGLRPESITADYDDDVWWCSWSESIGRWIEWRDRVSYRIGHQHGEGSPELYVKLKRGVNDLATTHPLLSSEWSDANERPAFDVRVEMKVHGWWKCSCCGHEWFCGSHARREGSLCPECDKHLSAGARRAYRLALSTLDAVMAPTPLGPGVRFRLARNPFDPSSLDPGRKAGLLVVTDALSAWESVGSVATLVEGGATVAIEGAEASEPIIDLKRSGAGARAVSDLRRAGADVFERFLDDDAVDKVLARAVDRLREQ